MLVFEFVQVDRAGYDVIHEQELHFARILHQIAHVFERQLVDRLVGRHDDCVVILRAFDSVQILGLGQPLIKDGLGGRRVGRINGLWINGLRA